MQTRGTPPFVIDPPKNNAAVRSISEVRSSRGIMSNMSKEMREMPSTSPYRAPMRALLLRCKIGERSISVMVAPLPQTDMIRLSWQRRSLRANSTHFASVSSRSAVQTEMAAEALSRRRQVHRLLVIAMHRATQQSAKKRRRPKQVHEGATRKCYLRAILAAWPATRRCKVNR